MTVRKVKRDKFVYRRVTALGELFFYALYKFKAYWSVGAISKQSSNRAKELLNINISNYRIELNSDYLIHFLNSHFDEKLPNQRNVHFEDIEKIGDVINYFSSVNYGNRDDTLKFKRKFPNGTFELVVDINHAKKILSGKSFRIKT